MDYTHLWLFKPTNITRGGPFHPDCPASPSRCRRAPARGLQLGPPSPGFQSKLAVKTYAINLVGGFNPSETYESQLGLLFPIYGKNMFQTTNQIFSEGFHELPPGYPTRQHSSTHATALSSSECFISTAPGPT